MKIKYLPSKITSTINGYELLLRLHNDLEYLYCEDIKISFKNVEWFEANLVAILGAIIEDLENKKNRIKLVELDSFLGKNDILNRNGFFPHYGHTPTKSRFNMDTQIPYKKFREEEANLYNQYIQKELLDKKEFPSHSILLGHEIKRSIFELFENARTHGKCNNIHTCGQFYPQKKRLHITIVDSGKTIVANVTDFLKQKIPSSECIHWAMKNGNTTKVGNTPGGLGLGLIFDFINLNKGKMQVVSSNGYWELMQGEIKKYDLNFRFNGTIVNLEFDISDNLHYSFQDEMIDLDNIF
ncbi:hypothetical protein JZ968_06665 [Riemerella anatipestifer]